MNVVTAPSAAREAAAPLGSPSADRSDRAGNICLAAGNLLPLLERGRAIDASDLRSAMTQAFGGTDAEGFWVWKDAYEACEAAQVLFLRKFGPAILAPAPPPRPS